jgi:hypothetical protein
MNRILTFTLSTLLLSAPALAQTAPEKPKIYTDKPIGEGDPSAISCYQLPSSYSRVKKMDCKPNSEWAQIFADDNRGRLIDTAKAPGPVNIMH